MMKKLTIFFTLFLLAGVLHAQTNRYVAPDGLGDDTANDCTVEAAPCATIGHATSTSVADDGDTIILQAGIYTTVGVDVHRAVSIEGAGMGTDPSEHTIIQGDENPGAISTYVLNVSIGGALGALKDLTIRHGGNAGLGVLGSSDLIMEQVLITDNQGGTNGGIRVGGNGSVITLINSEISNNSATGTNNNGGGIGAAGSTLEITNSRIVNNTSVDNTGGIHNMGAGFIIDSEVMNNTGNSTGGISITGDVTITNTLFEENEATGGSSRGGAIRISSGDISIEDSRFIQNSSAEVGGGLGAVNYSGELTVNNVLFDGNTASAGGAVHHVWIPATGVGGGSHDYSNVFFRNNSGGAIHMVDENASLDVIYSAFEGNEAGANANQAIVSNTDVTATLNWWGDASGPEHSSNPGGSGGLLSGTGTFDFSPWLQSIQIQLPTPPVALIGNQQVVGAVLSNNQSSFVTTDQVGLLFSREGVHGPFETINNFDPQNFTFQSSPGSQEGFDTFTGTALFAGEESSLMGEGTLEWVDEIHLPFITTWDTEIAGDTGDTEITIYTHSDETYNYDVYWEEVGNASNNGTETGATGDLVIDFGSAGIYQVEISGQFPRIFISNQGDKDKLLSVEQWGAVEWSSMEGAFRGTTNLVIDADDNPNLENVTSMAGMFNNASSLNNGLENWDVSNVEAMNSMFENATSFNGDLSGWNVGSVTTFANMFNGATAFNQDVGSWNVSSAESMAAMFSGAITFNQNIGDWDVSSVIDFTGMFNNTSSFDQSLGDWPIASTFGTGMIGFFNNSGLSVENYDQTLIGWANFAQDPEGGVNNAVTFSAEGVLYCDGGAARQLLIDEFQWVITGDALAPECQPEPFITIWQSDNDGPSEDNEITIPTNNFETYNYNVYWEDVNDATVNGSETDVDGDITLEFPEPGTYRVEISGDFPRIYFHSFNFQNNPKDWNKIIEIVQWGDIAWTSMEGAFYRAQNLDVTASDIPDLTGVNSLENMFRRASSLTGETANWSWNTETIEHMGGLFSIASSFNQDISSWDVGSVTIMRELFQGAESFNQDLDNWDVSGVTDMEEMFESATAFNGNIENWNVSFVANISYMFEDAESFNRDISQWIVSEVENMMGMFKGAISFNQDIGDWEVSSVTIMREVFRDATSFNQDLGGWNISSVTSMNNMLDNSGLSTENYDATLAGWAAFVETNDGPENITLGASGLEYCNAADARQFLVDNSWDISGDAMGESCDTPVGGDQRIVANNLTNYDFTSDDFGVQQGHFVKFETLPDNGNIVGNGGPLSEGAQIPAGMLDSDAFLWMPDDSEAHGYNYASFQFRLVSDLGVESDEAYTMTIHQFAAGVMLSGEQGWRFLTSPSLGETYEEFLAPLYVQGVAGSDNPGSGDPSLFLLNQEQYQWEVPGAMSEEIDPGKGFIVYGFEDDLPATLTSGQNWLPLDGLYEYDGLYYDPDQGPQGDSHFLIANPHPISLDFCQMYEAPGSANIAASIDAWDPQAGGGHGDYVNLHCAAGDVHIAPFQAFWIRTLEDDILLAKSSGNTGDVALSIPEAAYLPGPADGYFKKRSAMSHKDIADPAEAAGQNQESSVPGEWANIMLITLQVQSDENPFSNRVNILFSDEGTQGLDRYDAPKLSPAGLANQWLSFYALDDEHKGYALRSLPVDFGDQITIPLGIQTTDPGMFELTWELPEEQAQPGSYYLRDNHTGQVIELQEGQSYRFEIEPGHASSSVHSTWTDDSLPGTLHSGGGVVHSSAHVEWADEAGPRFELLVAGVGVDGFAELADLPDRVQLNQNYPNPFNPSTIISYELPESGIVRLDVFDITGRHVARLVDTQMAAGHHQVSFDAGNLSSGIYLYRLQAGGTVMTRQLTLIK